MPTLPALPLRVSRFALVGGSGVLVNLGVVALLAAALPAGPGALRVASAGGIAVSLVSNFLLNSAWTWGDRSGRSGILRFARYLLVSTAAGLLQWGVAVAARELLPLAEVLGGSAIYVAQLAGIAMGMGLNYVANDLWTYARGPAAPL